MTSTFINDDHYMPIDEETGICYNIEQINHVNRTNRKIYFKQIITVAMILIGILVCLLVFVIIVGI